MGNLGASEALYARELFDVPSLTVSHRRQRNDRLQPPSSRGYEELLCCHTRNKQNSATPATKNIPMTAPMDETGVELSMTRWMYAIRNTNDSNTAHRITLPYDSFSGGRNRLESSDS
jgi:hypothetical protein